ncbi:MAG: hypothetical protein LBR70_07355 [Lactobacillaceae bacterium]|jgi:hypothetical protein|nr:hypothetical protein [Lactobacillaceae bacterium]
MTYNSWTKKDLEEKNAQMFAAGALLAPVFVDFIKWSLEQTKRPAYCLLRDGQPIYDIAQLLKDTPEFEPVRKWKTKFLTRSMVNSLENQDAAKTLNYLKSEGLTQDKYVFLDTGYQGSIQRALKNDYNVNSQSLFMFYFRPGEHNDSNDIIKGYRDKTNFDERTTVKFCCQIFENLPKIHNPHPGLALKEESEKTNEESKNEWLKRRISKLKKAIIGSEDLETVLVSKPVLESSKQEQEFYNSFIKGAAAYVSLIKNQRKISETGKMAEDILTDTKIQDVLIDVLRLEDTASEQDDKMNLTKGIYKKANKSTDIEEMQKNTFLNWGILNKEYSALSGKSLRDKELL